MTHEDRLDRARNRGYLLAAPGERLWVVYRVRCLRQGQPCVQVSVRKGHANGRLDFDTTRNTRNGSCASLSEGGSRLIRDFCARAAPRARLIGVDAGSDLVVISRVPADEADALGAMLIAATTSGASSPSGHSDALLGSVATPAASKSHGGTEP